MRLRAKFSMEDVRLKAKFKEFYNVSDGGYERGYAEGESAGYEKGKTDGAAEGYEQGKVDGNILRYATKLSYLFRDAVFPDGHETVVDVPNISDANIAYMFYGVKGTRKVTINIPVETPYNGSYVFYNASVEEIVLPDGMKFKETNQFARGAETLKRIVGRINLSGASYIQFLVYGCKALEDISFVPNTIDSAITFAQSPNLSDDAIQSIIGGLADLTGATAQTLTLHATVGAKLTDAQKATITAKNWTLVY